MGGATAGQRCEAEGGCYFNPRSPWGERPACGKAVKGGENISIHAPRGGSDGICVGRGLTLVHISIHAPRGGSDLISYASSQLRYDFNPRSPWGERRGLLSPYGGDFQYFNPRSPWGERPPTITDVVNKITISIHAPRGGSDSRGIACVLNTSHFNPRSPWGERLGQQVGIYINGNKFQSTLPVGGATTDSMEQSGPTFSFQSTLPVGGATAIIYKSYAHDMCELLIFSESARSIQERIYDFFGFIIRLHPIFIKSLVRTLWEIFARFWFALHH